MGSLGVQLDRIWRSWPLVLLVVMLAVVAAGVATMIGGTTYTSRASLIASSSGQSPGQDAVLVQGFVDYFNDETFQTVLRQEAEVPADLDLSARTAAASPIVIIEATSSDSSTVTEDVLAVTLTFRDDMNRVRQKGNQEALETLQQRLDDAKSVAGPSPTVDQLVNITALQSQIQQISTSSINQLQELKVDGGFATNKPPLIRNVLFAFGGGVILAVMLALGLAATARRVRTPYDLRDRIGLPILAEIPESGTVRDSGLRVLRLNQLANLVAAAELGRPLTVVVVAATADARDSVLEIANAIADYRMELGDKTLLVTEQQVPEYLVQRKSKRGSSLQSQIVESQIVVVVSPPANTAAEAQVLCGAAGVVVLVVEENLTRFTDAEEAVATLRQVRAPILGAVWTVPRAAPATRESERVDTPQAANQAARS